MKRFIAGFILMGMITGCTWTDDLQTNLFSDVWEDHTSEINWFTSSNVLRGDTEHIFTTWAEDFENKQSNFIRIEPTKKYTVLSQEDALQNENDFFRLVKVVSAEIIQEDEEVYKHSFFRVIEEGDSVIEEEENILRGIDIQERKEDKYIYEKEERFVFVNSSGILQKFGTLSKKDLKKHKNDFFVSGELQGSTIIAGINLSQNIKQYRSTLEKLQTIEELQEEIMRLLFKVCVKQKSIVPCY